MDYHKLKIGMLSLFLLSLGILVLNLFIPNIHETEAMSYKQSIMNKDKVDSFHMSEKRFYRRGDAENFMYDKNVELGAKGYVLESSTIIDDKGNGFLVSLNFVEKNSIRQEGAE